MAIVVILRSLPLRQTPKIGFRPGRKVIGFSRNRDRLAPESLIGFGRNE